MKKPLHLVLVLALIFALTGVASAQDDGPSITLDPESVEEAGTFDVTVTGSGFTIPVFVLQCPGAGGDPEALTAEGVDAASLCDLTQLTQATPGDDGTFEVVIEDVEIDDCGLVWVAADIDQTETAQPVAITVDNPAEDAVCEVVESEGYDEDVAGAGGEAGEDGELAETGVESTTLALIAAAMIAFGGVVAIEGRRFRSRRI